MGQPVVPGIVHSRCYVFNHAWLQQQGVGFAGSAGLFWPGIPLWCPQGPLPASSRAHATPPTYSSRSHTRLGWKDLFPFALRHPSIKSYRIDISSFPIKNNTNPSFHCTFPLNPSFFNMAHSLSSSFLKTLLPFCKTRGPAGASKWS